MKVYIAGFIPTRSLTIIWNLSLMTFSKESMRTKFEFR